MENKMKKPQTCDSCETDFLNEIDELVDNVENRSKEGHMKKQEELDKAFESEKKKK